MKEILSETFLRDESKASPKIELPWAPLLGQLPASFQGDCPTEPSIFSQWRPNSSHPNPPLTPVLVKLIYKPLTSGYSANYSLLSTATCILNFSPLLSLLSINLWDLPLELKLESFTPGHEMREEIPCLHSTGKETWKLNFKK